MHHVACVFLTHDHTKVSVWYLFHSPGRANRAFESAAEQFSHSGNTEWIQLAHAAIVYPSIWMDKKRHMPPRVVATIEFATHLAIQKRHIMPKMKICFLASLSSLLHLLLCFALLSRH
jgi:hypothetical protein